MAAPSTGGFGISQLGKFGLGAGIGALSQFLGAQSQRKFFEDIQGQIDESLSSDAVGARFRDLLGIAQPGLQARARDARIGAEARGDEVSARFRRAGLTGAGESVAAGVKAGTSIRAQNAMDAVKLDLFTNAQQLQLAKARSLAGLLQTPFGAVSPAAAGVAGAGSGLEAVASAEFANQLSGRGKDTG